MGCDHDALVDWLRRRTGISFLVQYSEFENPMCSITVKCYQPSWCPGGGIEPTTLLLPLLDSYSPL
jgi:hypothetical protein